MKRLVWTITISLTIVAVALIPFVLMGEAATAEAREAPAQNLLLTEEDRRPVAADFDKARVWIAHLAPFAPNPGTAVTVTVGGVPVLTNFEFGETTNGYVALDPGPTEIQIQLPDGTPVLTRTITPTARTDYTVAAVGKLGLPAYAPLDLVVFQDDNAAPASGQGKVRIIHLAPFGATITETEVTILDESNTPLNNLAGVRYGVSSGYFPLAAGSYTLTIQLDNPPIPVPGIPVPVTLNEGQVVTVFAIGDKLFAGNQDVTVLPITYNAARAYVAHVAPFAADTVTSTTAVTVSINGIPALPNFKFGETSGGYVNLTLGSNTVEVELPNGAVAISRTFNLTAADYTIAAIGNGVLQPLELFALVDNNTAPPSDQGKVRIVHLAPFTSSLAATAVDIVTQDGGDLGQNDIQYKQTTTPTYLSLAAGTYDLKVNLANTNNTAIDVPPLNLKTGDIVTVFAVGDGVRQDLGVLTIPESGAKLYLPVIYRGFAN